MAPVCQAVATCDKFGRVSLTGMALYEYGSQSLCTVLYIQPKSTRQAWQYIQLPFLEVFISFLKSEEFQA